MRTRNTNLENAVGLRSIGVLKRLLMSFAVGCPEEFLQRSYVGNGGVTVAVRILGRA